MKALFITGINQYGVIDLFINGMQSDLAAMGIESTTLNLSDSAQQVVDESAVDCDFVMSFNGLGIDLVVNGQKLFTLINKPVFVFLVDHPLHVLKRIMGLNCTLLCIDQTHVQFASLCGFKAVFFPHAVSEAQVNEYAFLASEEKQARTIMPCSFQNKLSFRDALKPVWQQLEPLINASQNIYHFLIHLGVIPYQDKPARTGIDANILAVISHADLYLRALSRESTIKNAVEKLTAQPLLLVGRDTQQYAQMFPGAEVRDQVSVESLFELIRGSRYLLHNVPGFVAALHERLLFATIAGTLIICDSPETVNNIEPDLQLLSLGSFTDIDDKTYDEIRTHNIDVVRQKHTWRLRFNELLKSVM